MYGGSFNPLHLGHVDCILRAANLCERLYLVLSVGRNRDEIDGRVRYRWLYQLTKHIGNVKILMIEDDAPTKADYGPELWQADAEDLKARIGEKLDVVFCGSDYGEDSFWKLCYPESELVIFPRSEHNSTQIRRDPYGYWDWLPQLVRPYYTKRVLLIGGESTGKSTLTIHLARRFNAGYIDEAGRDLSERSGTDLLMLPEDFTEILLQQKLNEIRALEQGHKLLFEDTDALVTRFYMQFLEDRGIRENLSLAQALDRLNEYDLVLFLEPDVPFVDDGGRSPVIRDHRLRYSEQIKELLRESGRSFVSLSGDYEQRYETAVRLCRELLAPKEQP
jgi:HTH-type transcriptional repressor of NAD biosynthesis genes